MFINGDGNWVNILNAAVITYKNNIHSTINMTPVDASNNPDKNRYIISTSTKIEPKFKVGDYVRNADKRNIFSKDYTSNWNRELLKINEVLNTQPITYKIEDMNVRRVLSLPLLGYFWNCLMVVSRIRCTLKAYLTN